VKVWNRQLSEDEIFAEILDIPNPLSENGLIGYWKFAEGQGSTAFDSSGDGNDGTIDGAIWSDDAVGITCGPALCTPGEPICEGDLATICNLWGTGGSSEGTDCSTQGKICVDGQCL
jgi:hypothetical protein